jgi:hypothetical protein
MAAAIVLALCSFGVSLLTLFSGFGLGTLLLPLFALFLPVQVAVASTAIVHAANNLFKAGLLVGQANRAVVVRFGLPAIAASFAGALVLTSLSAETPVLTWSAFGRTAEVTRVKLLMGFLIVGFALFELHPRLASVRSPPRWLPVGGALSGFFGGLSGHQGALRAAFLAPLGLSAAQFAATQAVLALLVDGARLLVYGWSFVLAPESRQLEPIPWGLVAVATGSAFAGALLGKLLLPKVGHGGLRVLIGALLVVVGVALAAGVA